MRQITEQEKLLLEIKFGGKYHDKIMDDWFYYGPSGFTDLEQELIQYWLTILTGGEEKQ